MVDCCILLVDIGVFEWIGVFVRVHLVTLGLFGKVGWITLTFYFVEMFFVMFLCFALSYLDTVSVVCLIDF